MSDPQIRFDDGAAYERMMGVWSQLVGDVFLDWLAPPPGQRWIDVGCGSGAFTEQLMRRCAPSEIQGIDPSEAQLAFARTRPGAAGAVFQQGDAMALPFEANRFDAAVMALVIFFILDPAKGVAEMVRVVRPGGLIAAYAWDAFGGGAPIEPIWTEMRAMGLTPTMPPSAHVSRLEALQGLWKDAKLERIETRTIKVRRSFASIDEFWQLNAAAGPMRAALDRMEPEVAAELEKRVRTRFARGGPAALSFESFANAVKGFVPA
ncbi:MAG: class I SAM-dependent methyltransferase [Rhodopila sp.]